jgi:hypothetical protein
VIELPIITSGDALKIMRKTVVLLATAAMLGGVGLATATNASAAGTYRCSNEHYVTATDGSGASWSEFGYYTGNDYVPGSGQFSYAAIEAQCLLNTLGYNLTVDGYYGPHTQAAVADFQDKHGPVSDGFVGPQTWPTLRTVAR